MTTDVRTEMVHVRLSAKDKAAIEKAAARQGVTVSEYLRAAALTVMLTEADPHALRMLMQGVADLVHDLGKRRAVAS